MNKDIQMYVSGILHRGEERCVCVLFEEKDKSIEIRMPGEEILSNKGYSEDEAMELIEYLRENIEDVKKVAGSVNPMNAFMK